MPYYRPMAILLQPDFAYAPVRKYAQAFDYFMKT
jgi:hypothetical protein